MDGACSTYGREERRVVYRVLMVKPEGKRLPGRPRCRRQDNIKMDLQKWGHGLDQAGSGEGQVAGACECSNEPSGSIKCEEFLDS